MATGIMGSPSIECIDGQRGFHKNLQKGEKLAATYAKAVGERLDWPLPKCPIYGGEERHPEFADRRHAGVA
jgi:hypothetical protein